MTTTALITGTSSGIGLATAVRLAADGHRVVATMRDPGRSEALLAAAEEAGVTVEVAQLDVTDDNSVAAAFASAGPIDVLVNNAGASPVGAVEEFTLDGWRELFDLNLFGAVRCIQAALPAMRERGSGRIVNVSSMTGRTAIPMFGPYAASKWALEAMSESLAAEAAIFGIRVHLVEPGAIATPIREKTGAPSRTSPYRPVAKNWGFSVVYDHALARGPEEVAERISEVLADPEAPFRSTVGQGVDELIELRRRHTDEEWIDLWSSETGVFLERFRELTGADLTDPGTDSTSSA